MFYKLKTKMMEKILDKRKKENPFNYIEAENFKLNKDGDWTAINSFYFSAHKDDVSFYCRLGERNTFSEVWFYYLDKENRYYLKNQIYEKSPLIIYKDNSWKIEFSGLLIDRSNIEVNAKFEGEFIERVDAIDFSYNMPSVRMAKAIAYEKWSKEIFEAQAKLKQVHYEEVGVIKGTLTLGERVIKIKLPCVRDHSYGVRDWNQMNNHLWLMAINDNSQINFSMVSYPAMSLLEVGNFVDGIDTIYVLKGKYDREKVVKEASPEEFEITLKLENKKELKVKSKFIDNVPYVFQNGDYTLNENIVEFDVNGIKYRGILEIGHNKNKDRFYNGHKAGDLKE